MIVRNFTDNDVEPAAQMALDAWSSEFGKCPPEFLHFIYGFLVRFYDRNRNWSFAVGEGGTDAFLLAARRGDSDGSRYFFASSVKFYPQNREMAEKYREYVERNGGKVKAHMTDDDLYIGLFVSNRRGAGKALLGHLEEVCRAEGIRNIFLWADVSCNHSYYSRNGFREVEHFESAFFDKPPLGTMIFCKNISS